ncbi:MAG: cold shock domain-containing protein [Anaerolineae bacterium]|jgi:CspA family cold shock protein
MATRQTGIVKWFSVEKGYGFIQRNRGKDLFVHESDIRGRGIRVLHEGQVVEFSVESTTRGPKAVNVTTPWYT